MAENILRKYFWLINTIRTLGPISYEDINSNWKRAYSLNHYGEDLPKKTFRNHLEAIFETFGIEIRCERKGGYLYYIHEEDEDDKWMRNLLDTLTIQTSIGISVDSILNDRIADFDLRFEPILPLLMRVIQTHGIISFRIYMSFKEERMNPEMANYDDINYTYGAVCPLGLVQVSGNWYMLGMLCKVGGKLFGKIGAYRVADMTEIVVKDETLTDGYPNDFSIKKYISELTMDWYEPYFSHTSLLYTDLMCKGIKNNGTNIIPPEL